MKKFFAILMVLCMVLSMAACGKTDEPTETPTTEPTTNENPTESTEPTPTGHNYVGGVCQDEGCGDTLTTDNPLGVSNAFGDTPVHIAVREGGLLIIREK